MPLYDLAILVGGAAGTAAGLELKGRDAGVRVLLVEAVVCGGWQIGQTLAPGNKPLLRGLGCGTVALSGVVLECVQSLATWGSGRLCAHRVMFSMRGKARL